MLMLHLLIVPTIRDRFMFCNRKMCFCHNAFSFATLDGIGHVLLLLSSIQCPDAHFLFACVCNLLTCNRSDPLCDLSQFFALPWLCSRNSSWAFRSCCHS